MQADPTATPHTMATNAATSFQRVPQHGQAQTGGHGQPAAGPGGPGQPPQPARPANSVLRSTGFTTGAYQPSGDAYIDRQLQLEQALKRLNPLASAGLRPR